MSGVRSILSRFFIAGLAVIASCCVGFAFPLWHSSDPVKFVCYLIVALLVSPLKVSLPGITGTLTVNFLFTLLGAFVLIYVLVTYFVLGSIPGFSFLASAIIIFSGVQLFALGIMGEYLARIFDRSFGRPTYRVLTTTGSEPHKQ